MLLRAARSILIPISFVLCALTATLWVRSYFVQDVLVRSASGGRHDEIVTIPGQVRITFVSGWTGQRPWTLWRGGTPAGYPVFGQRAIYHRWYPLMFAINDGIGIVPGVDPGSSAWAVRIAYRTLAVPFALPLALTLWGPAWIVIRARRKSLRGKRWAASGRCARCGYDLRATPARCPECGATITRA